MIHIIDLDDLFHLHYQAIISRSVEVSHVKQVFDGHADPAASGVFTEDCHISF